MLFRANFTSDSNIAMVYLLREVAEAEEFFGNSKISQGYITLAQTISDKINSLLWNSIDNDHYVCF